MDARQLIGAHGRTVWDEQLGYPRCTANSKQSGERCKNRVIPGAKTCRFHGTGGPQARAAATRRMLDLMDPLLVRLHQIATNPEAADRDVIRIWENVCDRFGWPRGVEVNADEVRTAIEQRLAELDESGE